MRRVSTLLRENFADGYLQLLWKVQGSVLGPEFSRQRSGLIVRPRKMSKGHSHLVNDEHPVKERWAPIMQWQGAISQKNGDVNWPIFFVLWWASHAGSSSSYQLLAQWGHTHTHTHTHTHISSLSIFSPIPSVLHPSFFVPNYFSRWLSLPPPPNDSNTPHPHHHPPPSFPRVDRRVQSLLKVWLPVFCFMDCASQTEAAPRCLRFLQRFSRRIGSARTWLCHWASGSGRLEWL
jgi:hypothetical protein